MQPSSPFASTTITPQVSCRRTGSYWGCVLFFALCGVLPVPLYLFFAPRVRSNELTVACLVAVPSLIIALCCALSAARGFIIADAEGLRWRGAGGERRARWDEITDYYFVRVKGRSVPVIETRRGKLSPVDWTNLAALLETIGSRATAARGKSWDLRGLRPEDDWPRTYSFAANSHAWQLGLNFAVLIGIALAVIANGSWTKSTAAFTMMWQWSGPWLTIGYGLTIIAMLLILPVLVFCVHLPVWRYARAHRDEQLIATPTELTLWRGASTRTIRWSDVTAYYTRAEGSLAISHFRVVETASDPLEWTAALDPTGELARIVVRYATNATSRDWREQDRQAAEDRERRHYQQTGQRSFTYRTRDNRAMLWFFGALCSQPTLMWGTNVLMPGALVHPDAGNPTTAILFALPAVWLTWRYHAARISIDREGILQNVPFGTRFLRWSDIRSVRIAGGDALTFLRIGGRKRSLYVYASLEDLTELRNIVIEHLEHAGRTSEATPREVWPL